MSSHATIAFRALLAIGVAVSASGCATPVKQNAAQGPLDTPDRLKLAQAAADSGNTTLATSLYMRALSDPTLGTDTRIRAADMLVALGHASNAEAALNERLHSSPAPSAADATALRRALARLHIVAGRPADAVVECDALLARNSGDLAATVDKAVALDLLGRHAEAQALYRRALEVEPDDATVRSDLALSVALQGRISEAEALAAPLRNRPDLPARIKTDLGLLYAAGNDPGNAEPWLDGRTTSAADVVMLVDAMRARAAGQGR